MDNETITKKESDLIENKAFLPFIPGVIYRKYKDKFDEAGLKEGVNFYVSENIPANYKEKPVTLGDLFLKGNRHARRKAIALANKVK